MNIKEILEAGGVISLSYKEKKDSWLSSAKIYSISGGFGLKPEIIVEVPTANGRKEFDLTKIDEAIELFKKLVFNKKNLWFKMHEAELFFMSQGTDFDLDEAEDFEMVNKKRLELVKESLKNINK